MTPIKFEDCIERLLNSARSNSKKKRVAYDLDVKFLEGIWNRTKGCCEVSGIEFNDQEFPEALVKFPFAPSLDRMIPKDGYLKANVRLVCVCANFSMNEWGLDTLLKLARAVTDMHGRVAIEERVLPQWRARQEGRIEEAMLACERMSAEEARRYRQRIAGLRRALRLSRHGLSAAAAKAQATLAARRQTLGA